MAGYNTPLFFEDPKWLSIKPYFFLKGKICMRSFPDLAGYRTSLFISIPEVVGYKTSLLKIFTPKWLLIRPYEDFVSGLITSPPVYFIF